MTVKQEQLDQFTRTWSTPSGWAGWFTVVNNQPLGMRFMMTAFIFFLLGGVLALLVRVQLVVSGFDFIGPQVYNQIMTMHGSTMMYLFAVPFLEGLALYMLPLMIGSRDVAFPRLTAFSYWTFLFGGVIFYASFLFGAVPDVGWFAYTPLSRPEFSGSGTDFFLLGLAMVEIAGITAGIEIVVTLLKFRCAGMSINRMPLFAWAMLATAAMIIIAFTVLLVASLMLEMDRVRLMVGAQEVTLTRFFDPDRGGQSLLWQHLFWFFGHPEVYIAFLPATGIVSMVVAAFARRIIGYTLIAMAIIVTAFVSFGLWVHHMYTTGLPELSMHFFAAASLMIGIAAGVQVFAWIGSLWGSRPALRTPLLFVLGFIVIFVIGGFTGVMVAVTPFDWQVHDTFFIVAHFHYVLIGGVVFPIFAGLHYWLPKITGRMLSEKLGQWSFWLSFIGFNVTFFPMHFMGFFGLARRVYTYREVLGIDWYNIIATAGAFALAAGSLVFVVNFVLSLRRGEPAEPSPWGGDSLEWSVESPPPIYSFEALPVVYSRHPMWQRHPDPQAERFEAIQEALRGRPEVWRATLATDVLTGEPQAIQWLPGPSWRPFWAAVGLLIASVGTLAQAYLLVPLGLAIAVIAIAGWIWPARGRLEMLRDSDLPQRTGLPIFTTGRQSTAWWGMICLLVVIASAYGALFFSYFYLQLLSDHWPQDRLPRPAFLVSGIGFGLLAAAAAGQFWSSRTFIGAHPGGAWIGQALCLLLGAGFITGQFVELGRVGFAPWTNAYGSIFFVLHWTTSALVLAGMGLALGALLRLRNHPEDYRGLLPVQMQVTALYWYFGAAVGVLVFVVLYLSPYLF